MNSSIRVLIADDHAMVRRGLAQILDQSGEIKIVAECADGAEAMNWLHHHDCDAVLLDIAMPGVNGIDLLRLIHAKKINLPVLVISAYPEEQYAVRLIKAGAAGYLNKECAPEEIVKAVKCISSGKKYVSPAVGEMLANELCNPQQKLPHETLSGREHQILLQLASAKTVAEIAQMLHLSSKTISTYRSRILEKMQLRNNAELMRYALDHHIL